MPVEAVLYQLIESKIIKEEVMEGMNSMDSMGRGDRMKQNAGKLGKGITAILLVIVFGLAIIGALVVSGNTPAFLMGDGKTSVNAIQVEEVVSIMGDKDGDGFIDFQVTDISLSALRDIETGEVFLSFMGNSPPSEQ